MLKFSSKGSKLIIIFILTAIVSGSILTYLSITHISNYTELLEKKISEEERELTNRFASDFQYNLDSLRLIFSDYLQQDKGTYFQKLKNIDSINGLNNYIEIDSSGSFNVPYFVDDQSPKLNLKTSKSYLSKLKSAENNEFISGDFKRSELDYIIALKLATTSSDSAYVYNALGRLYVKMNLQQKAFDTYQKILADFNDTSNTSGFPYAYFSIMKLLKISNPSNNPELRTTIISFLNRVKDGMIPLNDSSDEIFKLILEWQNNSESHSDNELIMALIKQFENSLKLVHNYKISIENIVSGNSKDYVIDNTNKFFRIKPLSGSKDELMLFYRGQKKSVGFVVGLLPLFMKVKEKKQLNGFTFEYEVILVEKAAENIILNTNLVSRNAFSSYFEDSLIQVSLKNEDSIYEVVFKKKVTYGIGLFLFLGTMILGLYLLIQDVKREKRMNKLRADFISNVTHELKTPLTSIYMFAQAISLGSSTSNSSLKKYANSIEKESEKLKRMINNILEFSKKENNKLSYKLEYSNLTSIVNVTIKEMNYFLEINNIDIHLNISINIFANVYPQGIKQALSNLISNAIKYSSSNKKINIRLFKKGAEIFIEVQDFGIGIPEEKLTYIFEKFYRVSSSENESVSGTGLGLTVTKAIIEEHQGKLLVESTIGKGSKFTIVLNAA